VKQQQNLMVVPLTAELWNFFKYNKPELKMSNLDHDAARSAVNAAYFGAFLVKGNRFGAFLTATSPKKNRLRRKPPADKPLARRRPPVAFPRSGNTASY
jgi:hypothetical protein